MDDLREKVIRGLECCSNGICYAGKCPYENGDNESIECIKKLAEDALSLLKAQEPRVMTLEEAKISEVAWLERYANPYDGVEPIIQPIIIMYFKNGYFEGLIDQDEDAEITLFVDDFNREWRFWTSRPTDEQREAVKWDG